MNDSEKPIQNRSIRIGGAATGNIFQIGDQNTASLTYSKTILPPPDKVNIQTEVKALRELLSQLESQHRNKIQNAMTEAQDEVAKREPDKDELGKALDRALSYAKQAEGFADVIDKLKPHVISAASWLGENWHKIINTVGLAA